MPTDDTLLEKETIIRWDELDHIATLWTMNPAIRKEWQSMGFPVTAVGGGWGANVPADRISYKTLKKTKEKA